MIIISDTSPLSELAKIGQITLLFYLFGQVIIPQQVYDELTNGKHPAVSLVQSIAWLDVRSVSDSQKISVLRTATNLGLGECAAIILAEEIGVDRLLMDDLAARRAAESRNLPVIGTLGVLLLAKKRGLVSNVQPLMNDLIAQGMRISQQVYQQVLAIADEE